MSPKRIIKQQADEPGPPAAESPLDRRFATAQTENLPPKLSSSPVYYRKDHEIRSHFGSLRFPNLLLRSPHLSAGVGRSIVATVPPAQMRHRTIRWNRCGSNGRRRLISRTFGNRSSPNARPADCPGHARRLRTERCGTPQRPPTQLPQWPSRYAHTVSPPSLAPASKRSSAHCRRVQHLHPTVSQPGIARFREIATARTAFHAPERTTSSLFSTPAFPNFPKTLDTPAIVKAGKARCDLTVRRAFSFPHLEF